MSQTTAQPSKEQRKSRIKKLIEHTVDFVQALNNNAPEKQSNLTNQKFVTHLSAGILSCKKPTVQHHQTSLVDSIVRSSNKETRVRCNSYLDRHRFKQ